MSELVTKSVAQEKQDQKRETRMAMEPVGGFIVVAIAVAELNVVGAVALYAQGQKNDKYSLKSPGEIAFSDFRGYEDWSVVSSARTDEVLSARIRSSQPTTTPRFGVFRQ